MSVQLILNKPRLDPAPEFFLIHLENLLHVLGKIEYDGVPNCLSGKRSAPAAGQYRHVEPIGNFDHGLYVSLMARHDDANRLDLVHGSIRRIEQPRGTVEVNVSFETLRQFSGNVRIFIVHTGLHVDLSKLTRTTPDSGSSRPTHHQDAHDNQRGGDSVSECHNFYPFQGNTRKKEADDRLRIPNGRDHGSRRVKERVQSKDGTDSLQRPSDGKTEKARQRNLLPFQFYLEQTAEGKQQQQARRMDGQGAEHWRTTVIGSELLHDGHEPVTNRCQN